MSVIETVPHVKTEWPSGFTSFEDRVHQVAEDIGRQELTIDGAIQAQCDMPIYAYLPGQIEDNLDPWRYLEGLDEYRSGDKIDIWFESGACKTVSRDDCSIRFFADIKELEKSPAAA